MSVRAMQVVWRARIAPPTNKLVLLALADWCNDEGGSLHPSMRSIAAKAGVSRSQAQRIVRGFLEQGLLSVLANRYGGAPGAMPHYRLELDRIALLTPTDSADATPTDSTDATGRMDARGSTDALDGSHGCGGRVAPMRQTGSAGATQTTMNHHRTVREPSKGRARTTRARPAVELLPEVTEQALGDWDAVRKAKRAGPLTETAAKLFRREVEKAGLSLQQAVEFCCVKGWAGLSADWEEVRRLAGHGATVAALMTGGARAAMPAGPAQGSFVDVDARLIPS